MNFFHSVEFLKFYVKLIFCSVNTRPKFESSSSEGFGGSLGSEKPPSFASLGGAMKRYYQNGLSRHSKSGGGNVTQIPFNWFGSVAIGREQIVESPLVSGSQCENCRK